MKQCKGLFAGTVLVCFLFLLVGCGDSQVDKITVQPNLTPIPVPPTPIVQETPPAATESSSLQDNMAPEDPNLDDPAFLESMRQYGDAAIISQEEAADILSEIFEVQEYLSHGMKMLFDGTSEWIDGEYCVCIALGTEHEERFVREAYYAVSYYAVYRMDPITGEWYEVAFG